MCWDHQFDKAEDRDGGWGIGMEETAFILLFNVLLYSICILISFLIIVFILSQL